MMIIITEQIIITMEPDSYEHLAFLLAGQAGRRVERPGA